jgi:hypothetical protein
VYRDGGKFPIKRLSITGLHTHSCRRKALNHAYFTALPHPTHPSNLPKTSSPLQPRALTEQQGVHPATKKRKAESQQVDETGERIAAKIGRRLEY